MSLQDYAKPRDKFEAEDATWGGFSFPCVSCIHRSKTDQMEPCRTCDHNEKVEAPK